jgi:phosphoribosylaminoimidazole carboxylase
MVEIPVEPHPQTMRLIQDKFLQKQYVSQHGVPVTPFCDVSNMRQLQDLATRLGGYPYMLKSKKLAYDGRGNYVVRNAADIQPAFQYLCGNHGQNDTTNDDSSRLDLIYAEKWVSFEKELAVMVAKSVDGSVVAYPCVETVQENNICRFVYAPALVDAKVAEKARHVAMDAIRHFPGAGVFGVELFLLSDGISLVTLL